MKKKMQCMIWAWMILFFFIFIPFSDQMKNFVTYRNDSDWVEKKIEDRMMMNSDVMKKIHDLNPKEEKLYIILDESVSPDINELLIRYYAAPIFSKVEKYEPNLIERWENIIAENNYTKVCVLSENLESESIQELEKVIRIDMSVNELYDIVRE